MKTYATLGPACCRAELLTELLGLGLTGFRLNLSHTTLAACRPWTDAVQAARRLPGRDAELIIDMRGPELRMGPLSRPVALTAGPRVTLSPAVRATGACRWSRIFWRPSGRAGRSCWTTA